MISEGRDLLRTQQITKDHNVVECDGHSSTGQRMPHVERIAQDDQTGSLVRGTRQI